jgi:hypothetical protein
MRTLARRPPRSHPGAGLPGFVAPPPLAAVQPGFARPAPPGAGHDFARLAIDPAPTSLQTRLHVNTPGDVHERQAERVAERVMRSPDPHPHACPRPSPAQGGHTVPAAAPPGVAHLLRSSSQPLDPSTRAFMEPRFGHDFSRVRIHADEAAARAATTLRARAFTVDRHVVFGAGEYAPGTDAGRRLLAHELTHVVQQGAGTPSGTGAAPLRREGPAPAPIQRQEAAPPVAAPEAAAPAPDPLPAADELTRRIARCIGIWETNRGGDQPAPRESALDTVAGVAASMATIEQATMSYAITALRGNAALRALADPPLTMAELNAANARAVAVTTLLGLVNTAAAAGTTPDDFIAANAAAITATGLPEADVRTMFRAVTLRGTLDAALTAMNTAQEDAVAAAAAAGQTPAQQRAAGTAARNQARTDAIAAIPQADRLGLGVGSLSVHEGADREDEALTEKTARPAPGGRTRAAAVAVLLQRLAVDLQEPDVVLERRALRVSPAQRRRGSGHQVVKRGVMPRDMKWSSPSAVEAIASSTVAKPNGRAISTPATKLGIT